MTVIPTLARAAKEYLEALSDAVAAYHSGESDKGRNGAIRALHATAAFIQAASSRLPLEEQIEIDGLKEPFLVLASALHDLDTGSVHPLVRPSEIHNRRTMPEAVRLGRGKAAAAMEILVIAGMDRQNAAKHVAQQLGKSEVFDGIKRNNWKAVAAWRDELRIAKDRVSLGDWRNNPHARPDVIIFDYFVDEARTRFAKGEWDAAGLRLFADSIVADGGWTRGSKQGRANLK